MTVRWTRPLLLLAVAAKMAAAQTPLDVRVEGDTGCLTAEAVRAAVTARLPSDGRDVGTVVTIHGQSGDGGVVSFDVWKGGRRFADRTFDRLEGTCADRTSAVALSIALALRAARAEAAGAATPPVVREPPRPAPPLPPPSSPAEPPARAWRVEGGPAVLLSVLPAPAFALALQAGRAVRGPFALRAGIFASWPGESDLSSGRVRTSLAAAHVDACLTTRSAPWSRALCAGVATGVLRAQGVDFATPNTGSGAWTAAKVGLSFGRPSGPVRVSAGVDGLLRIASPRLEVVADRPPQAALSSSALPRLGAIVRVNVGY